MAEPDPTENDAKAKFDAAQAVRRADLASLGNDFKKALSPITLVVELLKDSNIEMMALSEAQRRQTRATWGTLALMVIMLLGLGVLMLFVHRNSVNTNNIQRSVATNIKILEGLASTAQSTNASVNAAEARALTQPTMHLLPELDPVKAEKAPLKIVIEAPAEPPPKGERVGVTEVVPPRVTKSSAPKPRAVTAPSEYVQVEPPPKKDASPTKKDVAATRSTYEISIPKESL